jgi:hypothetical protein
LEKDSIENANENLTEENNSNNKDVDVKIMGNDKYLKIKNMFGSEDN